MLENFHTLWPTLCIHMSWAYTILCWKAIKQIQPVWALLPVGGKQDCTEVGSEHSYGSHCFTSLVHAASRAFLDEPYAQMSVHRRCTSTPLHYHAASWYASSGLSFEQSLQGRICTHNVSVTYAHLRASGGVACAGRQVHRSSISTSSPQHGWPSCGGPSCSSVWSSWGRHYTCKAFHLCATSHVPSHGLSLQSGSHKTCTGAFLVSEVAAGRRPANTQMCLVHALLLALQWDSRSDKSSAC